jgi:ATP-dependent DNA ligase
MKATISTIPSLPIDIDGVVAKRLKIPYSPPKRTAMVKIKPSRTVDCIFGGFRYGSNSKVVGSLLLGLYDDEGLLDHVGSTANIAVADRAD